MSNSPMIPVFSPDGVLGYVPVERLNDAKAAGGKVAIKMQAPNGKDVGYVPADKANDAAKAGAKPLPYDAEEANGGKKEGFWNAFSKDLKAPLSMFSGLDEEQKPQYASAKEESDAVQKMREEGNSRALAQYAARKAAGHSTAYAVAAPVVEGVANVQGMEQAAAQGDTGGVLGHMAAGQTAAAAPLAASSLSDLLIPAKKTAVGLYTSALKPSPALPAAESAQRVQTGLENAIPVSEAGVAKLNALVSDLQNKVSATIATKPTATVNKMDVASRLGDAGAVFKNQVNPEADLAAIQSAGEEFVRTQPNDIPVADAQALKTGTYRQLKSQAYGTMKPAAVEAQKALARGIKEELETQFPEIKGLNAQEGKLLNLDKSLERAVNRINNWEPLGINAPIAAGAAKAVTGSSPIGAAAGVMAAILRNPAVKSRLAIALARKGVPANAVRARISAYTLALANSAFRAGQDNAQEDSQ